MPRLLGAQAAGVAPMTERLHGDHSTGSNDAADGIQIVDPVESERILTAIDKTDGDVIAVSEAELETELQQLHRRGFYTEPTCAVAPAVDRRFREQGRIDDGDAVGILLTGSGFKSNA